MERFLEADDAGAGAASTGAAGDPLCCTVPSQPCALVKEAMKLVTASISLCAAIVAAPAFAQADLAQKKNCMACHAIDKKLVGPAYKDVAAKYAGQKDAVDKLAQKVMKGGAGVWGAVPMPANPQVNEAEAKQLVQWIMTLK
jgi:cytochrome c